MCVYAMVVFSPVASLTSRSRSLSLYIYPVGGDDARMTPNGRTYSLNLSRYLNMVLHEHESPDSHDEEEAARQLVVLTGTARVRDMEWRDVAMV